MNNDEIKNQTQAFKQGAKTGVRSLKDQGKQNPVSKSSLTN